MKKVDLFVSYAHRDSRDVDKLMDFLDPHLKTSMSYKFSSWRDQQILPGEFWRREIENALVSARFGLLLLSPEFLASEFIRTDELPELLAKTVVVPVGLHSIPLDGTMDLKGLHCRQIFRDLKVRPFGKCRTPEDKRAFALELSGQIHKLLKKYAC